MAATIPFRFPAVLIERVKWTPDMGPALRSVLLCHNGWSERNDEVTQEVRCGVQGEGSAGGASGGFDGSGAGQAARGAPEPDLRLEEAGGGQYGEPVRTGREVSGEGEEARERETAKLYSKIGEPTVERDLFARRPSR